ncbi:unnamed protein product [Nippostrongylus brasiliensis]|uniref:LRAT domain-containing protein n=1 Tax=Nippostrongylus brasiliensis TaxID=27835 RepID=A0A0N4YHV3_NIPBR|nr:unnamed protein product [Nippostrongylus brasiliensis]
MLAAGQLVSEWYSAEDITPYVQLGDLLEFRRHWAVFIGRHEDVPLVVHLSGDDGDFDKFSRSDGKLDSLSSASLSKGIRAQVRCDPIDAVAGGDLVRVNNEHDIDHQPFPPRIVVERATMKLGEGNYNIVSNNCEHFVKWCRYGNSISRQAIAAKSMVLTSALALAGTSPILACTLGMAFFTFATPVSKLANRYFGSNFSLF